MRPRRRPRTAAEIVSRRAAAAQHWRAALKGCGAPDAVVPHDAPSYFIDRFAFARAARAARHPGAVPPGFDVDSALHGRDAALRALQAPAAAVPGWVADLDEPVRPGPLWRDIRRRWKAFCERHGLPRGAVTLNDIRDATWRELFASTVFRPRPPVFVGPHHLERLDAADRRRIAEAHGQSGGVDFFVAMTQIHETLHASQTGEPLLNEVIQAACWIRFLDEEELWLHQRNSRTREELPRESAVIRTHPDLFLDAVAAGLDTARLVEARLAPSAYHLACAWANAFDRGALRYADYLAGISSLFAQGSDERWVRAQVHDVSAALTSLRTGHSR